MKKKVIIIRDNILKNSWMLLAPLLIASLLMIVYAIKGIYPFGKNNICYFDMSQLCVPVYYHIYDVLHFKSDPFLNWNVANGVSLADALGSYLYFPTNLFFLFVKRNKILESMSFFLMLKLSLSSFFMTLFARRVNKNKILAVFCGITYAACGFSLQYYTIIAHFIDSLMLFPLLMLSYYRLVEENKNRFYIICFSFVLLLNIQTAFAVCLFLLIKTGLLLLDIKDLEKKKKIISNMLISSISGVLLASFYLIPCAIQLISCPRVLISSDNNYFSILSQVLCGYQQNKNFMLYSVEFVFPLLLILVFKRNIKKHFHCIIMIVALFLPIFFESMNILWAAGTYQMFPLRYGYMLTFECIYLLLSSEEGLTSYPSTKISKLFGLIGFAFLPLILIVLSFFMKYFHAFGIRDNQIFLAYWLIILLISLAYLCIFISFNQKVILFSFAFLTVSQALLGFWGFIGAEIEYAPECEDDIIVNSEAVLSELNSSVDEYRTKDVNNYLNANYGFITQSGSGAGWVNGFSNNYFNEKYRLGYVRDYTRSLDAGGTAFSDYLLGYNYAVLDSSNKDVYINDLLYSSNNKYLFNINYSKYGFYSKDYINNEFIDPIDYQNSIYHSLIDDNEDLFNKVELSPDDISECKEGTYELSKDIDISDCQILYLYGFNYGDEFDNVYTISVNGEQKYAPFLYLEYNNQFPIEYRNGFLDLGYYKDERINVKINGIINNFDNLMLCCMDYDKYVSFCNYMNNTFSINYINKYNNKIKLEIYSEDEGIITLPIGYSENWIAYNNGKRIKTSSNLNGLLLAVNADRGINNYTIKFRQKGLYIGLALSVLGICLLFASNKIINSINDKVSTVIYRIYEVVLALVLLAFYFIPIIYAIVIMILYKISPYDIIFYAMLNYMR